MFNTVIPVAFVAATGITNFQKFVSSINFQAQGTGITVQLVRDFCQQPGTGTAAIAADSTAGQIPAATHKYWLRARSLSNTGGFVDSALSAACVNDSSNTKNTIVIPAQPSGVAFLDLYRLEGAGSVTGQLVTTFQPSAVGGVGLAGTGGNLTWGNKYQTITGFTYTDIKTNAALTTTGSNTTGTTNTSGQPAGSFFANALGNVDVTFTPPLAGAGCFGIVLTGTGTVTGVLRGR